MDVIIGVVIIAMVAGTVAGALSSLMRQSTSVYSITRATWMGNSVMEIWSAKEFDDIEATEDFTLDQYPGYSANVLVEPKDYDSDLSRLVSGGKDSQYKKIIVDISSPGFDNILTYETLVSLGSLPPPYITRIYTDYECPNRICGDNESDAEFAEQADEIPIKVVFDREISVSNIDNITLTLNNVTQSVPYGTDGIEGDMWYHNNLLNELLLDEGLLDGYGDDLVSKVDEGQDPITATGSSISQDNLELTFIYARGAADSKYHTSTSLDDYLDVERINLNDETIEGLINETSDGVEALDEDENGFIDLPTETESMLINDEVIILNQRATFYIFYEEGGDRVDGWEALQKVVNPVKVEEIEPPSMSDIYDTWTRFDGNKVYEEGVKLGGNSKFWYPKYIIPGGDKTDYAPKGLVNSFNSNKYTDLDKSKLGGLYTEIDHFVMSKNVTPTNGFISPQKYEDLTFETTLHSTDGDNDVIGLIAAYAKGSSLCDDDDPGHPPELCTTSGTTPYVIMVSRSGRDKTPYNGWGMVYGQAQYSSWKTQNKRPHDSELIKDMTVGKEKKTGWSGKYVRVKIVREKNIIRAYTTSFIKNGSTSRQKALEADYLGGDYVMTLDLTSKREYHKFIGGSNYGFATYSQKNATYMDIVMPQPDVVEANVDYVIYFHNREDTDNDGNYDTWAPFDLSVAEATGDEGRNLAADKQRSGIWKWDKTLNPARWVFRENALNDLLGRTVQEATGYYRIISPDADMFGSDHMFTKMIGSPVSGDVSDKYLIRSKLEVSDDY